MSIRVVLAGGGTGGHLFPLITVAKHMEETLMTRGGAEFLYIGPKGVLEKEVMSKNNIPQKTIMTGKLHRYMTMKYFLDIFRIPIGVIQSLWILFWYTPDVVFAKGGFASVPVVIAARLYAIPVLIHESDAVPGLANKFLGSIANRVMINFERARMYFPASKTVLTGIPVKSDAIEGDISKGREFLKLHKEVKPVIFFIGGSLGAQVINERVMLILPELLKRYQVVHQTGRTHYDFIASQAQRQGYKIGHSDYYPIAFIGEELKHIFALADLVISRAGGTAISEIAANGKASILVPITKSANNHQRINAYEVSKAGGAVAIEESNFQEHILLHNIDQILNDEEIKKKMQENIKTFYFPNATEDIAKELIVLGQKSTAEVGDDMTIIAKPVENIPTETAKTDTEVAYTQQKARFETELNPEPAQPEAETAKKEESIAKKVETEETKERLVGMERVKEYPVESMEPVETVETAETEKKI